MPRDLFVWAADGRIRHVLREAFQFLPLLYFCIFCIFRFLHVFTAAFGQVFPRL
jgi:hypothetical protein